MEGNLRFKIDWASLTVGSKFTVFALCYFVFEGNFPSASPRGAYIWRGHSTEDFLRCLFGGAYIWRGLFSEFYGILSFCHHYSRPSDMSFKVPIGYIVMWSNSLVV